MTSSALRYPETKPNRLYFGSQNSLTNYSTNYEKTIMTDLRKKSMGKTSIEYDRTSRLNNILFVKQQLISPRYSTIETVPKIDMRNSTKKVNTTMSTQRRPSPRYSQLVYKGNPRNELSSSISVLCTPRVTSKTEMTQFQTPVAQTSRVHKSTNYKLVEVTPKLQAKSSQSTGLSVAALTSPRVNLMNQHPMNIRPNQALTHRAQVNYNYKFNNDLQQKHIKMPFQPKLQTKRISRHYAKPITRHQYKGDANDSKSVFEKLIYSIKNVFGISNSEQMQFDAFEKDRYMKVKTPINYNRTGNINKTPRQTISHISPFKAKDIGSTYVPELKNIKSDIYMNNPQSNVVYIATSPRPKNINITVDNTSNKLTFQKQTSIQENEATKQLYRNIHQEYPKEHPAYSIQEQNDTVQKTASIKSQINAKAALKKKESASLTNKTEKHKNLCKDSNLTRSNSKKIAEKDIKRTKVKKKNECEKQKSTLETTQKSKSSLPKLDLSTLRSASSSHDNTSTENNQEEPIKPNNNFNGVVYETPVMPEIKQNCDLSPERTCAPAPPKPLYEEISKTKTTGSKPGRQIHFSWVVARALIKLVMQPADTFAINGVPLSMWEFYHVPTLGATYTSCRVHEMFTAVIPGNGVTTKKKKVFVKSIPAKIWREQWEAQNRWDGEWVTDAESFVMDAAALAFLQQYARNLAPQLLAILEISNEEKEVENIVIVSELYGEDLITILERRQNKPMTNHEKMFQQYSCLRLLKQLHDLGLAHLDFTPENILYGCKGFKLCDFSKATPVFSSAIRHCHTNKNNNNRVPFESCEPTVGKGAYMPPECWKIYSHLRKEKLRSLLNELHSITNQEERKIYYFDVVAADSYMAGVLLFWLWSDGDIWKYSDIQQDERYYNLVQNKLNLDTFSQCRPWPRQLKNLLKQALNPDPKSRASLSSLINHPWFEQLWE